MARRACTRSDGQKEDGEKEKKNEIYDLNVETLKPLH